MRDGRAGFSAVALDALPVAHAKAWATEQIRDDGTDFESALPGGEIDQLYSIETAGEALKLLARVHAYLDASPEALGEREVAPAETSFPIDCRIGERHGADHGTESMR